MITRCFLAHKLDYIKFYKLMCDLQNKIYIQLEKKILTTKTEIGKTCYLKLTNSKKASERGLKEVWTHLSKVAKTPWRLVNDLSNGKITMIGSHGSDHPYKYYSGAGYVLKYSRDDSECFYHPLQDYNDNKIPVFKENIKNIDIDTIYLKLNTKCQIYFDNTIEQLKIEDAELDKKAQQVQEFIEFLNLTPKQINYVLGTFLRNL